MLYTCVRCTHILHCDVTRDMERKNTPSSFWCFIEAHSPHLARYFTSIAYDLPPHLCATCHLPLATCTQYTTTKQPKTRKQKPKPATMETVRPPVLTNTEPPSFHFQSAAYHMVHAIAMHGLCAQDTNRVHFLKVNGMCLCS